MLVKLEAIDSNRATIAIDGRPAGVVSIETGSTIRAIHFGGPRKQSPWLQHERRSFDDLSSALQWIIDRQNVLTA